MSAPREPQAVREVIDQIVELEEEFDFWDAPHSPGDHGVDRLQAIPQEQEACFRRIDARGAAALPELLALLADERLAVAVRFAGARALCRLEACEEVLEALVSQAKTAKGGVLVQVARRLEAIGGRPAARALRARLDELGGDAPRDLYLALYALDPRSCVEAVAARPPKCRLTVEHLLRAVSRAPSFDAFEFAAGHLDGKTGYVAHHALLAIDPGRAHRLLLDRLRGGSRCRWTLRVVVERWPTDALPFLLEIARSLGPDDDVWSGHVLEWLVQHEGERVDDALLEALLGPRAGIYPAAAALRALRGPRGLVRVGEALRDEEAELWRRALDLVAEAVRAASELTPEEAALAEEAATRGLEGDTHSVGRALRIRAATGSPRLIEDIERAFRRDDPCPWRSGMLEDRVSELGKAGDALLARLSASEEPHVRRTAERVAERIARRRQRPRR